MAVFRIVPPVLLAWCLCTAVPAAAQEAKPLTAGPFNVSGSLRTRVEAWDWFDDTPQGVYVFNGSILRVALTQPPAKKLAWHFEIAAPLLVGLPDDAVRPGAAGALGLGANYYAANGNDTAAAGLFLKQATLTLNSLGGIAGQSLRVGRMEFVDGAETAPKHPTVAALKRDRIAHRLLGTFAFSHVGRSYDGVRYALDRGAYNVTALAARPTRGVFDVNGWPELKINVFYGALTRSAAMGEWRAFGLGYQDYRQPSHINIVTVGAHYLRAMTTAAGTFDVVLWTAGQRGSWRTLAHHGGAVVVEGGWQPNAPRLRPWLRAGYNGTSGDSLPADDGHDTFFQVLPTPRIYARFPFFNMMNMRDAFGTLILRPTDRVSVRADVHALRLWTADDAWYQGGGAFQNHTFGYASRPSNGHTGVATLADASADVTINRRLAVNVYFGHASGRAVPNAIYGAGSSARFGYAEAVLRF